MSRHARPRAGTADEIPAVRFADPESSVRLTPKDTLAKAKAKGSRP